MKKILSKLKNKIMKNSTSVKLEQLDKDLEDTIKEMEELNKYVEEHLNRINYLNSKKF